MTTKSRWVPPPGGAAEGGGAELIAPGIGTSNVAVERVARSHRTAFSAVKHVAERKGDHWELKDSKGPSDPQSAQGGKAARDRPKETFGGVDASRPKAELYEEAKEAGIDGRSKMSKTELARALQRRNERETRKARR